MGDSISLRAALSETLQILRANPIHAILVFLINAILALSMLALGGITDQNPLGIIAPYVTVPAILLTLWTMPGMSLMALRAASGESWNVGHMFAGGRWIWRYLGILMIILILIAIVGTIVSPFYAMLSIEPSQRDESDSALVGSDLAQGEIESTVYSSWGRHIAAAGSNIFFAAIYAAISFSWYLVIDKEMGVSNAIKHGFVLVRSIYPKVLIWYVLFYAPNSLQFYVPGSDALSWLLRGVLYVLTAFVLTILYRERLRQWEAEAGQPLRHESMLSLPREPSDETGLPDNLSGA